jgi:TolA-binding protein
MPEHERENIAALPLPRSIEASRSCAQCGRQFPAINNRGYCSNDCLRQAMTERQRYRRQQARLARLAELEAEVRRLQAEIAELRRLLRRRPTLTRNHRAQLAELAGRKP